MQGDGPGLLWDVHDGGLGRVWECLWICMMVAWECFGMRLIMVWEVFGHVARQWFCQRSGTLEDAFGNGLGCLCRFFGTVWVVLWKVLEIVFTALLLCLLPVLWPCQRSGQVPPGPTHPPT